MYKVEILIVTHAKDLPYLHWALKSIKRFASEFSGVTVVYPKAEAGVFDKAEVLKRWYLEAPIVSESNFPIRMVTFDQFPGKGFLHHMHEKLMADHHCPDADFILHFDSDQIFREPVTPEDYFVNGKPRFLKEPYSLLEKTHKGRFFWKSVTEATMGFACEFETMCCPGQIYPRWLYTNLRAWLERKWGTPFLYYVLLQRNEYPQSFGEHNSLGAYAHEFERDAFHWIEVPKETRPKDKIIQSWSHGPLDKPQQIWMDGKEVIVVPEILFKQVLE